MIIEESDASTESSAEVHPKRKQKGTYRAWRWARKLEKFKEGGKNITFLSYDGAYGQTDKVLVFVKQFDAAFGREHFTECSKLRHIAMHF